MTGRVQAIIHVKKVMVDFPLKYLNNFWKSLEMF